MHGTRSVTRLLQVGRVGQIHETFDIFRTFSFLFDLSSFLNQIFEVFITIRLIGQTFQVDFGFEFFESKKLSLRPSA
jgi:hypothetical protein